MTIHVAPPDCFVVVVQNRTELDAALEEAVDLLKPAAITEHVGILVTRLTPGRYEARLNSSVPPGMTIEKWGSQLSV